MITGTYDIITSTPKAEVTGSNPVGCANDFNRVRDGSEGSGFDYFRIIPVW
jgi:hypothetical protein